MSFKRWTIYIALFPFIGMGAVINTNDWQTRTAYPTRIGGTYNPTVEQLREAGWREYVPCASVESSNIVATSYSDDGVTVTATCEYGAAPVVSPYMEQEFDWPLLQDHPPTNDIPAGGMTYRLDGNPITWWIVRQSDVIATQLSAHDNQGNPIVRTINLITGEDEVINLRSIVSARNFNELNAASRKSTNAAIKARNLR